jgi:hypothetical protein
MLDRSAQRTVSSRVLEATESRSSGRTQLLYVCEVATNVESVLRNHGWNDEGEVSPVEAATLKVGGCLLVGSGC